MRTTYKSSRRPLAVVPWVGVLAMAAGLLVVGGPAAPALAGPGVTSVPPSPTLVSPDDYSGPADAYTANTVGELGLGPPPSGNAPDPRGPLQPVTESPRADPPGEINGIDVSSVGRTPTTSGLSDRSPPGPAPEGGTIKVPEYLQPLVDGAVSPSGGPAGEGVKQGLIHVLGEEAGEKWAPWMAAVGPAAEFLGEATHPNADPGLIVIEGGRATVKTGVGMGTGALGGAGGALIVTVAGVGSGPVGWIIILTGAVAGSAAGNYVNTYAVDPAFDELGQDWANHVNWVNQTCNDRTEQPVRLPGESVGATPTTGGPMDVTSHIRVIRVHVVRPPTIIRGPGRGPCRPGCPDFRR